jgi:UDP-N-acetyl-D-glucosamine dehydrogenase
MTLTSLDRIDEIKGLVGTRKAYIDIVGMGYVGLPRALLFSEERFAITGRDIDPEKISALNQGRSYIVSVAVRRSRRPGRTASAPLPITAGSRIWISS